MGAIFWTRRRNFVFHKSSQYFDLPKKSEHLELGLNIDKFDVTNWAGTEVLRSIKRLTHVASLVAMPCTSMPYHQIAYTLTHIFMYDWRPSETDAIVSERRLTDKQLLICINYSLSLLLEDGFSCPLSPIHDSSVALLRGNDVRVWTSK